MEYKDIEIIANRLRSIIGDFRPEIGIILGSGLGKFVD